MTLREWLLRTKIKVYKFAELIEVDRSYLSSIMKGRHIPSDQIMQRVEEVTMGEVREKKDLIGLKFKEMK